MKYSYNWLKKLSKTKKSPEQLAELLTMHSFEFDGSEKYGDGLENIVVGEILEIRKHPNADKLHLTLVNAGKKNMEIVCGANNIKKGDKVPVAVVGTVLPNGMEIKKTAIRGIESFGMLCAEDELGLGDNHDGILILDSDAKVGQSVSEILDADDTIMEIKVLSNRGHDALSHIGMAREITALENRSLKTKSSILEGRKGSDLKVEIKNKKLCNRYIGVAMEGIEIKDSPAWAKSTLQRLGLRPINNVVDAINYVMLETGQPMHAFDAEKLLSLKVIIREAKNREKVELLDDTIFELSKNDLIIADQKNPIAIAGIMGGKSSAISPGTKKIILESANFNAASIRKTRQRLSIQTDSSERFEKGLDPNLAEIAMARLVEILESFGGKVVETVDSYPKKSIPKKLKLDLRYVEKLLGETIPKKEIVRILNSLELKSSGSDDILNVEIPSFRIDLETQEDLIEEIGRIYGYENIKSQAPLAPVHPAKTNAKRLFERGAKNILVGAGFSEIYNYSFYSIRDAELSRLGSAQHLELENPMNPNQALMRVSLVPNILKNIRENLKNFSEFNIFEIGNVYWPGSKALPEEKNMLVGSIIAAKSKKKGADEFYLAKGHVDTLLEKLGIFDHYYDDFNVSPSGSFSTFWHQGRIAEIKIKGTGQKIGHIGEISPPILAEFDIGQRVVIFEIDMEKLKEISESEMEYRPISKYPTVQRDISMITESDVRVDDILKVIQGASGDLVLDVDLFDIFDFDDGSSSYAFHIIFGSSEKTLESAEIDALMEKISASLENNLQVKIRK